MTQGTPAYGRLFLAGAGVLMLITAAAATALALAGLMVGVGMVTILFGVPIIAAIIGKGEASWASRPMGREEWYLVAGLAAIAGFTFLGWQLLPPGAWVAVPIVGLWAALSLYGLSKLEPATTASRREARIRRQHEIVAARGNPDTLVRRWSDMLSDVDIFRDLSEEERERVAALGNARYVREGQALGIEGQEGRSVYVVLEGEAQLSANSSIGRITARVAGPGESLPLAAVLGDGRLITSIVARSDMRVWEVDSAKLRSFFSRNPEIAAKVYYAAATVLAERYRTTLWRLTEQSAAVARSESFWANV